MLTFEPNTLREAIVTSLNALPEEIEVEGYAKFNDPQFDPAEYEDVVISDKSTFDVCLPCWDNWESITVRELIEFAEAYRNGVFIDSLWVHTETQSYFQIEPSESRSQAVVYDSDVAPIFGAAQSGIQIDDKEFSARLKRGLSPFTAVVVRDLSYSDYFPPKGCDDVFVVVKHDSSSSHKSIRAVAEAFLFEIANAADLVFALSPFQEHFDGWEEVTLPLEHNEDKSEARLRMRQVNLTKGMSGVQNLYLQATQTSELIGRFVGLAKVFEYIAPTVIRQDSHSAFRNRLMTPGALDPNAEFVDGLMDLARAFGNLERKDGELIKQTIQKCCDASVLGPLSPKYLAKLQNIKAHSTLADRKNSLGDFATRISATRNWIVHAKTNYTVTGLEVPEDKIEEMMPVMRSAAKQAIAWFASIRPEERIVGTDDE